MLKNIALTLLKSRLNDTQLKEFSKKYDEVEGVVKSVNNPKEALAKFGVSSEDLKGAKGFLDNGLVKKGLKAIGLSSDKANGVIDSLTDSTPVVTAPSGRLKAMQDNLARLRK